ncbi:hypothetical protein [uncultured Duncaniella sp.]|uniref:hypothetical protein n=1 Tax=uncultured Duncaniella sp. TaxID=2768039 RepID=UPI002603EF86|nr:hypothetical protein [uncultured Duncaniella sp.]
MMKPEAAFSIWPMSFLTVNRRPDDRWSSSFPSDSLMTDGLPLRRRISGWPIVFFDGF